MAQTVATNRKLTDTNSPYNALHFVVRQMIRNGVNTAIPVLVNSCTAPGTDGTAGYVSATPLVCQRDAEGNALAPVALPKLPFFRMQCGTAAVVMDPQPGDIGLAVFAQQDCSTVRQGASQPVQAGSFRAFDMADGFYLGGFLNVAPETWIKLDPEAKTLEIKAPGGVTIDAPTVEVTGAISAGGEISNSVALSTHVHSGVEAGESNTGGPAA